MPQTLNDPLERDWVPIVAMGFLYTFPTADFGIIINRITGKRDRVYGKRH